MYTVAIQKQYCNSTFSTKTVCSHWFITVAVLLLYRNSIHLVLHCVNFEALLQQYWGSGRGWGVGYFPMYFSRGWILCQVNLKDNRHIPLRMKPVKLRTSDSSACGWISWAARVRTRWLSSPWMKFGPACREGLMPWSLDGCHHDHVHAELLPAAVLGFWQTVG